MRLLVLTLASMLGASWCATTGTISVAISSQNNAVLSPVCTNGQWWIQPAYNLAVTVTAGGASNTAVPSTNNGAVNAQFVAAYLIGGKPAPASVANAQGTSASAAQTNTWVFKPGNGVTTQTATVKLKVNPACTATTAKPVITTTLSSPSSIVVPGGNGVTAITTATAVTVVNKLPAVNNAGTTKTTTAATKAPTTAAPTAAAGDPGACSLVVPNNPLSAAGLATPYVVSGNGCDQTLAAATFVQGAVLNLDTGALFAYNPLVILKGTQAAITPTVPTLPANNVVGLWFGTNSASTTLVAAAGTTSLTQGNCVNGGGNPFSIFGQFASCNGAAFFAAAAKLVAAKKLVIPALGVDNINGNPCPTTRDFGVVDQDPSDNVCTTYLTLANGQTAQDTPANRASLTAAKKTFTVVDNGSDEKLITLMQPLIGCKTFLITDLADKAATPQKLPNFAANELQAINSQQSPIALIPALDPMVVDANGAANLAKLNAYRAQVGSPQLNSLAGASTIAFCNNMFAVGAPRILSWLTGFVAAPPPDFAAALSTTLAGVLAARFNAAVGADNLNCAGLKAGMAGASKKNQVMADVATTAAPDATIDTTLDMTLSTPFAIMMFNDTTGALILPTTFDVNGSFPIDMTWEEAVGISEQLAVADPTDTPATTTDTTTTTSSGGMSITLYIAIGAGAAVVLVVIIAAVYYFNRRANAKSFATNAQQTAQMTKV